MKKLLTLMLLVLLAGCSVASNEIEDCSKGFHLDDGVCVEDINDVGEFKSSDDIMNLYTSFREKQNLMNDFMWRSIPFAENTAMDGDFSNEENGSDDYSETNNQVEGVDEMDNILTDGKYLYIQNYNTIQIVLAYTVESGVEVLELVKEIPIDTLTNGDHFYFSGMYVDNDRLLVLGNSYYNSCDYSVTDEETTEESKECNYYDSYSTTTILEYSKDDFTLENTYELRGNMVGTRKINHELYIVTNQYIPFYLDEREEYDFNIEDYLPFYTVNDSTISASIGDIRYQHGTNPSTFTSFFGINLTTQEVSSELVLGEGGYNLYVSTEHIYLTGTKWDFDSLVLEAMQEAQENNEEYEIEENPYEISTSIVKIKIDNALVSFQANGEVPGMTLDQFAMDENNGYTRIVTTTNNWWFWWDNEQDINNRLFILDENLDVVSTLENIGKEGESVQATRFVGDYAYVVTFLRTDPFYVIDVSDPNNPEMLSELEIPGFSDYLQPINNNYMLGIGYGDNDGGTQGLKISLYDISDKSNAIVASEIIYPYSDGFYMWTTTVYNHKDLLVSLDKGIIALPYMLNDYTDGSYSYRSGALILNIDVDEGTISERGRVEHSATNYWDTRVYKAKYIDNYLYTISSQYVKVSDLSDPETILNSLQIGESKDIDVPDGVEE